MFERMKSKSKDAVQKKETGQTSRTPNMTGIPDTMKTRFENLSGFSFDDVRIHYNSGKPEQLQALAYTQGNHVYIAPGQEPHLGHELGHVVQQKAGSVMPDTYVAGFPVNTSSLLESRASQLAASSAAHVPAKEDSGQAAHAHVVQRELNNYYNNEKKNIHAHYEKFRGCDELSDDAEVKQALKLLDIDIEKKAILALHGTQDYAAFKADINTLISERDGISPEVKTAVLARFALEPTADGIHPSLTPGNAQNVYSASKDNLYEKKRRQLRNEGEDDVVGKRNKLFLLRNDNVAVQDKVFKKIAGRDSLPTENLSDIADDNELPILALDTDDWSLPINDAFVGGGADALSRFKISDLSDESKHAIEQISISGATNSEKEAEFLERCKTLGDTNLYDQTSPYPYVVLAREIAQLLGKGYVFASINSRHADGVPSFQAFANNNELTEYRAAKQHRTPPSTALPDPPIPLPDHEQEHAPPPLPQAPVPPVPPASVLDQE